MKIIITESQYKLLVEDDEKLKLLRRITSKDIDLFVDQAIDNYAHDMCDNFFSEGEYANIILTSAAKSFFVYVFGRYPIDGYLIDYIYSFFESEKKEYLKKVFIDTCR